MSKNKDIYISSMSPTIGVKEQRDLLLVTKKVTPLLTKEEFTAITKIYEQALSRVLKENGMEA